MEGQLLSLKMRDLNFGALYNLSFTDFIIFPDYKMTTYTYSITSDFGGNLNPSQLVSQITNNITITTSLSHINTDSDVVHIVFDSTLSPPELSELNSLISSYAYLESPKLVFETSGDFGTVANINISQTENRTLFLPDVSDTILGQTNTATLSGKTILCSANTVSKSQQTIVDLSGNGDFTLLSAAIAAGRTSILIRSGTYVETTDINIPNKATIIGEANGQVAIVFVGAYTMKIDGSGGVKETTGTISISNNSSSVSGSGTTFTNLSPGAYILIGNNFYEIGSIQSDTALTLTMNYIGNNVSDDEYLAQNMLTGITVQNLIIANSSSTGLFIRAVKHTTVRSVSVTGCSPNILVEDSGDSSLNTMIVSNGTGHGVNVRSSYDFVCNTLNIFNNTGNGLNISGKTLCTDIVGLSITCNGGCGINAEDTSSCLLIRGTVSKQNFVDGIHTTSTTSELDIKGCIIVSNGSNGISCEGYKNIVANCVIEKNGGYGIDAGDKGIVQGNQCNDNGGVGIIISENNNIIFGNRCVENTTGILCSSSNNIVNSNNCYVNDIGINISVSAVDTIVTNNQINGNTTSNYINNGTGTINNNNIS